MFVKNLTNSDLLYKAQSKIIILKANSLTHIGDALATAKEIKEIFMQHVEILHNIDEEPVAEEIVAEETKEEIVAEETKEEIVAEETKEEPVAEEIVAEETKEEIVAEETKEEPVAEQQSTKKAKASKKSNK